MVPGRLVSSAKSWLAHGGVDRTAPILPWGAGVDVRKISPVEASARYLRHIREVWNASLGRQEGCRLEKQMVMLTVPSSFDEAARELTVGRLRRHSQLILWKSP
jgi:molecular chaperone DnaK (HSP70)